MGHKCDPRGVKVKVPDGAVLDGACDGCQTFVCRPESGVERRGSDPLRFDWKTARPHGDCAASKVCDAGENRLGKLPLVDRDELLVARTDVPGARADQAVVFDVLDDVGGPPADA